jgi:hypothetical protein
MAMQLIERMRLFTVGDAVLILVLLACGAAVIPLLHDLGSSTLLIYRDNRVVAEYPLDHDRDVKLEGVNGPMVIAIRARSVTVQSSSCSRQICMHAGGISRPFQQLICAPNHVLLEIKSGRGEERIDAVAQ